MDRTKRHDLNLGYVRLNVWGDANQLFKIASLNLEQRGRSLREYLEFFYIALVSSGEAMTKMIGISKTGQSSSEAFERFDELHYSTEKKSLALDKALQSRTKDRSWNEYLEEALKSPLN